MWALTLLLTVAAIIHQVAQPRIIRSSPLTAEALKNPSGAPAVWHGPGMPTPIEVNRDVVLWGASGSGKTCFLAALDIALVGAERKWNLAGSNEASTAALDKMTTAMMRERRFPYATEGIGEYSWIMSTDIPFWIPRRWPWKSISVPLSFKINVCDPPGESFGHHSWWQAEMLAQLAQADGIIFFYDPVSHNHVDTYDYTFSMMRALERYMRAEGRLVDGKLPHRISICVTKFDDPYVFKLASEGDYLEEVMGVEAPVVSEEKSREFFDSLCTNSLNGRDEAVSFAIRKFFHPSRIRYFVTSSIGFYVEKGSRFEATDCCNRILEKNGLARIRGQINPINVLEPLLWLEAPTPTLDAGNAKRHYPDEFGEHDLSFGDF